MTQTIGAVMIGKKDTFESILKGMADGDRPSAEAFVRRFLPAVKHQVFHQAAWLSPQDREDILWEVMMKLVEEQGRRVQGYRRDRGKSPRGYVKMKAWGEISNILAKRFPKHAAIPMAPEIMEVVVERADGGVSHADAEQQLFSKAQLQRFATSLPRRLRALFAAVYVLGEAPAAYQVRLGLSPTAMRRQESDLNKALRRFMADEERSWGAADA